jgi:hypothetical protein
MVSRLVSYHALLDDDCITFLILSLFFLYSPRLIHFKSGEDRLDVVARDFRVTDSRGDLLFAANRKVFFNLSSSLFLSQFSFSN